MINDIQTQAQTNHSIWNIIDAVALIGGLTTPAWWHTLDVIGQGLIVFFAVVGGALRCAILIRDLRNKGR